ncbi:MAG: hypothetical protein IH600_11410 [Bacteroidetes bacterium]|nr:hypothetical protein [Bacteroidota bacterium]
MQHTELLHRFFDEGLEEPLEDILFGQMALDPELRREFTAHLKLHSMIQEDVAGITTPSHVSQQLFTTLGLTPPVESTLTRAQRLRSGAGAALLSLHSRLVENRKYIYTAALSAIATAVLLFSIYGPEGSTVSSMENAKSSTDNANADAVSQRADNNPVDWSDQMPADEPRVPAYQHAIPSDQRVVASDQAAGTASQTKTSTERRTESFNARDAATSSGGMQLAQGAGQPGELPVPRSIALLGPQEHPGEHVQDLRLDHDEVVINEVPTIDPPWKFFQPGPQTSFLSNLVFELRKYYGTSYPDVDLQHNSHKVFENMAISVVYKATEHHAFGFEYGRENFGREYQRTDVALAAPVVLDQSVQQMYTPPAQWITGPQRENRMLDLVGAVWKLSLPEYGLFDVVYPYLRTFVGATKLGPLGKVRAGLEMYPSNFSMLNVGIEGGMLRYTVDDMSYYTTKLNFTFGVAIGF